MQTDTATRPELGVLPPRLAKLRRDARGYPVPFFVAWLKDGMPARAGAPGAEPDFRVMDPEKFKIAVAQRRCWVCGETLGAWLAFPIGPMCAITRTTAEPPCHLECATWSIQYCPFLSQPQMARRSDGLPDDARPPAGHMITRNPGVTCLWVTRSYEVFGDSNGRPLITVGPAARVSWWMEGRSATRAEAQASIDSGIPALMAAATKDGRFAVEQLGKQAKIVEGLLPQE